MSPIFDKEREQNRLAEAQLIGEIGAQAADIARTQGDISGLEAAKEKYPGMSADELRQTDTYKAEMAKFGTGSALQQGIQAATAAVQGLAGGNLAQAVSGAAAPYLAEQIHKLTEGNPEAQAMAHAVVGAVTSYASGNSALAGATGAVSGELMAQLVAEQLYPGRKVSELTETEKQTISALGTLAAGLAGGLAGDGTAAVISGAQDGRNAVENNFLGMPVSPVVPVAPPVSGNGEVNPGNGCNGASVCVMTKPDGSTEDTPPFTDGPSIVEARDEAANSRDPNVAKDLTEAEKAELGGTGSGTPGGWEPQDEESARSRGQHEEYKDELRQQMEKPSVKDNNLKYIIDDLYRPNAKVGSGSTADAVRYELATGEKVGGRGHIEKAKTYSKALEDWLNKIPTASPGDRAAAENVLKDLQNALRGK